MQITRVIGAIFGLAALSAAAPATPSINMDVSSTEDMQEVSDYFNLLAKKALNGHYVSMPPTCDLSRAVMPNSPEPLESPVDGLTLHHVAIGRGVQNYTCTPNNATDSPKAIGAVATLFNASCLAAVHPDVAAMLPRAALRFNMSDADAAAAVPDTVLSPSNLGVSGKHFFTDEGVPFFNLDTPSAQLGKAACKKDSAEPAPQTAALGQQGESAVAWLRLNTTTGTEGTIRQVYRVHTAGGSPPSTCEGMPETFSVQYAAQYWFWEGDALESEDSEES